MEAVKQELTDILLAIVKGIKVIILYMIPSILIAIAAVPDIGTVIQENPSQLLPYIINAVALALVTYFQPKIEKLEEVKG